MIANIYNYIQLINSFLIGHGCLYFTVFSHQECMMVREKEHKTLFGVHEIKWAELGIDRHGRKLRASLML